MRQALVPAQRCGDLGGSFVRAAWREGQPQARWQIRGSSGKNCIGAAGDLAHANVESPAFLGVDAQGHADARHADRRSCRPGAFSFRGNGKTPAEEWLGLLPVPRAQGRIDQCGKISESGRVRGCFGRAGENVTPRIGDHPASVGQAAAGCLEQRRLPRRGLLSLGVTALSGVLCISGVDRICHGSISKSSMSGHRWRGIAESQNAREILPLDKYRPVVV